MNEQTDKTSPKRGLEVAVEQFYKLLPALIGALVGAAFTSWVAIRDNSHAIRELEARVAPLADCVRRVECDAVQVRVQSLWERMTVVEGHAKAHEKESDEWKRRIVRVEDDLKALLTVPAARPDKFTGTEAREMEERLNQRLRTLERRP